MEKDASDAQEERAEHDRKILNQALEGMSVDQLRRLRTTIIRLKHLPFTKLTEVLFTEAQDTGEQTGSDRTQENHPAFAEDFHGHCESEANRVLFEDVQTVIRAKEEADRQ